MREMAHVVAWFTGVIVVSACVTWAVNAVLGIQHVNADGTPAGLPVILLHHLPYYGLGAVLVWLHYRIFGR